MLQGETSGLGIDFTTEDGLGSVAVKGHTTDLNNVPVDSFLTNSGTSPKLVRNASGVYVWTPHNLFLQSEDFTTTWSQSNVANVTANFVEDTSAVASGNVNQTVTTITGATYTYSVRVLKDSVTSRFPAMILGAAATNIRLNTMTGATHIAANAHSATMLVVDEGAYWRFKMTFVADSTSMSLRLYPAITASSISAGGDVAAVGSITADQMQLNRGTVPTTYLKTTSAARFGVPMEYDAGWYMLTEPAATNLLTHASGFDNAVWAKSNATVTADNTVAPDGLSTADKLVDDGATGTGVVGITRNVTITDALHTFSFYAKAGDLSWASLQITAFTSATIAGSAYFDLVNGVLGATNQINATITSVGNGWYRCTGQVDPDSGDLLGNFAIYAADANGDITVDRDGTSSIYLWNAQLETGFVATSPIPTFGATVTRAVDNINVATSAFPLSTTVGTGIIDMTAYNSATAAFWSLSDGTSGERYMVYGTGPGTVYGFMTDGGSAQLGSPGLAPGSNASYSVNVAFKHVLAWAANDVATAKDGGTVGTDASATLPTVNILRLGSDHSGASAMTGRIRSFVYLPRRMSNTELQAKTA